jgi:hypothetical protein
MARKDVVSPSQDGRESVVGQELGFYAMERLRVLAEHQARAGCQTLVAEFEGERYSFSCAKSGEVLLVNITSVSDLGAVTLDVLVDKEGCVVQTGMDSGIDLDFFLSFIYGLDVQVAEREPWPPRNDLFPYTVLVRRGSEEVVDYEGRVFSGREIYRLLAFAGRVERFEFDGEEYSVQISTGGQNLVIFIKELGPKGKQYIRHYNLDRHRFVSGREPGEIGVFKGFMDKLLKDISPLEVVAPELSRGEE